MGTNETTSTSQLMEYGKRHFAPEQFLGVYPAGHNVVTAYNRTLVSTTLLLRQPGHDLLTRLPNGPISVHTRQTRVCLVWLELCHNACFLRHCPKVRSCHKATLCTPHTCRYLCAAHDRAAVRYTPHPTCTLLSCAAPRLQRSDMPKLVSRKERCLHCITEAYPPRKKQNILRTLTQRGA